ncbi:MAG TPA: alanine dehydrogenase [Armatimonadota bacterium]|nr:alanine dehydrogenase [Armatimonadota bacterium]
MLIGVPKEIKADEYRVSLVPAGVEVLTKAGHTVVVEAGAGLGTGISDADYAEHGAEIAATAADVWRRAELIVKVKEPLEPEYPLIRRGQVIFTYFHLAANEALTRVLLDKGPVCIAYETMEEADGSLPLLTPMSEVAGRMAIQEGAKYLERPQEGRGILLSGVPGVPPANIVILGGGVVGLNAAKIAVGIGALVTVLDVNMERLRYLDDIMPQNGFTLYSNAFNIRRMLREADLLVGAVLIRGDRAPVLVTREMLGLMKPRAVIVDVAVDQGGCVETIRPTTHSHPTYMVDGILHYGVANMPGAVAGTSTYALTNVTLPYLKQLADQGWRRALRESRALRAGLNVAEGRVVFKPIAELFGLPLTAPETVLADGAT